MYISDGFSGFGVPVIHHKKQIWDTMLFPHLNPEPNSNKLSNMTLNCYSKLLRQTEDQNNL